MIYLYIATGALEISRSTPEIERRYVQRLNAASASIAEDLAGGAQEALEQERRRNLPFQIELHSLYVYFSAGSPLANGVFGFIVTTLASDPATAFANAAAIAGVCTTAVRAAMKLLEPALRRALDSDDGSVSVPGEPEIRAADVPLHRKPSTGMGIDRITLNLLLFMLALCLLLQVVITLELVFLLP